MASGLIIANVCSVAMNSLESLPRDDRSQTALDLFPYFGWTGAHCNARLRHCLHLVFRFARATGNDRAGMAHAAPRRSGLARDESDDGFLDLLLDISRGRLLGVAADLADHHDRFRVRVVVEYLDRIQESCADNRIATDAD